MFKEFDPLYVRYFILLFHYRSPIDFTKEAIKNAGEQLEKIKTAYQIIAEVAENKESEPKSGVAKEILTNFENAMNEDFNTPLAISELLRTIKLAKQVKESGDKSAASELLFVMNKIAFVLGLDFSKKVEEKDSGESEKLLEIISDVRNKLRSEKNYQMSDNMVEICPFLCFLFACY